MKRHLVIIMSLWTFGISNAAATEANVINQPYSPTSRNSGQDTNILLTGTPYQISKFTEWLDQIAKVPKGRSTVEIIANSGHQLVIRHARYALISAGRALGPVSANLINGKGESVEILFNAHIPDTGSHMVFDGSRQLIEYTAVQNLYHELAHAMHMMAGTWRYFASERQAIEEENIFRKELAEMQGLPPTQRFWKTGVLISNVDNVFVTSEWFGPTVPQLPEPVIPAKEVVSAGVVLRSKEFLWHTLEK
jgi:hypothetical protein